MDVQDNAVVRPPMEGPRVVSVTTAHDVRHEEMSSPHLEGEYNQICPVTIM